MFDNLIDEKDHEYEEYAPLGKEGVDFIHEDFSKDNVNQNADEDLSLIHI